MPNITNQMLEQLAESIAERVASDAQTCPYVRNMDNPTSDSIEAEKRYRAYVKAIVLDEYANL